MGKITWKLKTYLQEHKIKPREVENRALEMKLTFGRNTIYRLLRDDGPDNLSRETLAKLIEVLRSLTKRKTKLLDLIDYQEDSND